MARHLVLLGGGHAHLPLLMKTAALRERGHDVTLVSSRDRHLYSGMGPGLLGGTYEEADAQIPVRRIVESGGGRFVAGRAVRILPQEREVVLASGERIGYDVLSVNTGSGIARTIKDSSSGPPDRGPTIFYAKPIEQLLEARRFITTRAVKKPPSVIVVGGGPAGVEIAGNVRALLDSISGAGGRATVTLVAGRGLLRGFGSLAGRVAERALSSRGVTVRSAEQAREVTDSGLVTDYGLIRADVVIVATGLVPSRLFADSGLPVGADGSLGVNERLQALGHPEIFGGGDCVWFSPAPLARAGVYAVRQGPVLARNVGQVLDHGTLARLGRFRPGGGCMLLLNLGDGTAIFRKTVVGVPVVFRSHAAWRLKDRIDRAFVRGPAEHARVVAS